MDKSTSWHIISSLWRKLTRAGNPKRQGGGAEDEEVQLFFDKSEKREAGRGRGVKGKTEMEEKEWKPKDKGWNLHTRGPDLYSAV